MSEEDRKWLEQLIEENKESDSELTYTYCPFSVLYALQHENRQLKQKYEMQKDSNKLLCKAITCDDCDCKVCEAHKENIKYKSVLDEIREQLKKIKPDLDFEPWSVYKVSGSKLFDLLQILDKVGKE